MAFIISYVFISALALYSVENFISLDFEDDHAYAPQINKNRKL